MEDDPVETLNMLGADVFRCSECNAVQRWSDMWIVRATCMDDGDIVDVDGSYCSKKCVEEAESRFVSADVSPDGTYEAFISPPEWNR